MAVPSDKPSTSTSIFATRRDAKAAEAAGRRNQPATQRSEVTLCWRRFTRYGRQRLRRHLRQICRYANRLLLVVMALLYSLQLFPVAGTQLTWTELLPIVAAAMLLADGANCIERNVDEARLPRLVSGAALWAGPLFAALLFLPCGKAALSRYQQWREEQPLGLPGAQWLRLKPVEAARLTVPVSELRQHCRTVLTIPGMYSYSIWSGVPPAEAKRINSWPFMWPEEVLKEDLPKLQEQDGGCVLVDRAEYQFFKNIAVSRGNDEILSEVQRTMSPVFTFQDITVYQNVDLPRSGAVMSPSHSGR